MLVEAPEAYKSKIKSICKDIRVRKRKVSPSSGANANTIDIQDRIKHFR